MSLIRRLIYQSELHRPHRLSAPGGKLKVRSVLPLLLPSGLDGIAA